MKVISRELVVVWVSVVDFCHGFCCELIQSTAHSQCHNVLSSCVFEAECILEYQELKCMCP
jgi:hypothetical protein